MKKNYAYLRVSTDAQDETHQKESINKYCASNNINIERFIVDHGVSGFKTDIQDRQGLQKILSLAQEGEIDKLIIFESSRLSRNHIQSLVVISELSKYDVKIVSVTEGIINEGETSELLNSIRAFINQTESKKMGIRIKSAKDLMVKNNQFLGGSVPLGYKVVDKYLKVDETLRPIIKDTFQIYLNYGSKKAKEHLKSNNINITSTQSLMQILKNRCYIGYPYKTKEHKDIFIESLKIIDDSLFNDVQEAIKQRTTYSKSRTLTDRTTLLCESIIYHTCNEKMHINSSKRQILYRCRCKTKGLQKNYTTTKVDSFVASRISTWFNNLSKETLQQKFNASRNDELKRLLVNEARLSSLLSTKENALENAEKRLEEAFLANYPLNMLSVLTDGIDNLKASINSIKDQIQEIENNITNEKAILEKQNKLSEQLLDFKYLFDKATPSEKKLLTRAVVDKVIINTYDDIEVQFKY